MMTVSPFLLALTMGSLIYTVICRRSPWHNPIDICTTFLLGMGTCALLTFYQILWTNRYDPLPLMISTWVLLFGLVIIRYFRPVIEPPGAGLKLSWVRFSYLAVLALIFLWTLSMENPYGDWDAWSFWNFRAHYLLVSGEHWKDVYTYGIQAKHPWLLPHWTLFGWTWSAGESTWLPRINAQLLAVMVVAIVVFGLLELTGVVWAALLAGLWLVSIPYFLWHSIAQYADILMACFIPLNMLLILRLKNCCDNADAFILGLMLGFMAFAKDEGTISCVIMVALIRFLVKPSVRKGFYFCLFIPIAVIGTAVILEKIWMIPAPSGENQIDPSYMFDCRRWFSVTKYFYHIYMHPVYGGIILFPIFWILMRLYRPFDKNVKIMTWFLICFIMVFFILYILVHDNFYWRLEMTAYRLTYQIMPLGVILLFYNLFKRDPG